MANGTGNFRNFQISREKDNLERWTEIFETIFRKVSVPFDFEPGFPEILVEWNAPCVLNSNSGILVLHVTPETFPYWGIRHVGIPLRVKFTCIYMHIMPSLFTYNGFFGK